MGKTVDGMNVRKRTAPGAGINDIRVAQQRAARVAGVKSPSSQSVPVQAKKTKRSYSAGKPLVSAYSSPSKPVTSRPARAPRRAVSPRVVDAEPEDLGEKESTRERNLTAADEAAILEGFDMKKGKAKKQKTDDFLDPVKSLDLDFSSEEIKQDKKGKKKKSKKKKVIIAIIIIFFVLLIGGGVALLIWGDSIISKITGGKSGLGDLFSAVTSEELTPLKKDSVTGRTNVLLFGTSGYEMSGSDHDGAQLTDTIMVVSLDQDNNDLAMVSLPRDLYIGRTCTATGKINEVYWCNNMDDDDEKGGAEALTDVVENIMGINIQYYVHMNWGALVQLVDILGGITVTVDEDINDYGWTNIVMQAGVPTTLDGEQALGLARARHGTVSGDFTRGTSQQKIIMALKDRIVQKGISITDAFGILNTLGDNVRTDLTLNEMKTGFKIGTGMDLNSMRSLSLLDQGDGTSLVTTDSFDPGTAGYAISYVIPVAGNKDYTGIQSYIKRQFSADPAVRENANILVLNGTDEYGVAGAERVVLENLGYRVGGTDNAPEGLWRGISLYDVTNKSSGTIKALEKKYGIEVSPSLPVEIDATGYDIVIVVGIAVEETNQTEQSE